MFSNRCWGDEIDFYREVTEVNPVRSRVIAMEAMQQVAKPSSVHKYDVSDNILACRRGRLHNLME